MEPFKSVYDCDILEQGGVTTACESNSALCVFFFLNKILLALRPSQSLKHVYGDFHTITAEWSHHNRNCLHLQTVSRNLI